MVNVVSLGMTSEEIAEIADAFTCGQKAFTSDQNPYNNAFLTWEAFEEGQAGLTTAPNLYRQLVQI